MEKSALLIFNGFKKPVITPELLTTMAEIDGFNGGWKARQNLR